MQVTIAQQLALDVTTVANFFMNARRRGADRWRESDEEGDGDGELEADGGSSALGDDPLSPSETGEQVAFSPAGSLGSAPPVASHQQQHSQGGCGDDSGDSLQCLEAANAAGPSPA